MPSSYGIGEAKTRFSELVTKAEAGETIWITRNGVAVAALLSMVRLQAPIVADAGEAPADDDDHGGPGGVIRRAPPEVHKRFEAQGTPAPERKEKSAPEPARKPAQAPRSAAPAPKPRPAAPRPPEAPKSAPARKALTLADILKASQ